MLFVLAGIACGEECSADGIVVHAITGEPVPNAQVAAESPDSRGAATDVNGTFVIPGVPCGRLRLTVTGFRFFPARIDQTESHDIRMQLMPESAVGGTVTDANGNPVQGARIQVYQALAIGRTRELKPIMELNAESGTWRVPLPAFPGYVLCAESDSALYPVGGGGQLRYPNNCSTVNVHPGEEAHLDFTLTALPTVHVRGSVSGLPEGVEAVVQFWNAAIDGAPPREAQRTTGGQFDLAGIVPNFYTFRASAVDGDKSYFAIQDVNVGSGGFENLRLSALPGISISGSVRFELASGQPKPKVRLDLLPDSGSLAWDEGGDSFTISNVIQRKYRMVTFAEQGYIRSMKFQGRDVLGQEIELTASTDQLEVVVADDFGRLEGAVTDADGKPVAASVLLERDGVQLMFMPSDKNGRFAMPKIPPGHYIAYAVADPRIVGYDEPNRDSGTAVDVPPLGSATITLVRTVPK
jgi:hypothetical protein